MSKIAYRIVVSLRNSCATAIVHRDAGRITRKVGRVSWKCESDDGPIVRRQAIERAMPIVLEDQRKRGVRPKPVPPFNG
jgi:hypothetical protein